MKTRTALTLGYLVALAACACDRSSTPLVIGGAEGAANTGGATNTGGTEPVDSAAVPPGYVLVWSDEFDTDGLPDGTKWGYDTYRNRDGWWNDELQYYAAERLDNARVEAGNLIVTARKESTAAFADSGGQEYTSARLITQGKHSWTYGFFEVRAKLPCGRGTWPAIWMLGDTGTWPAQGEIDIMEHVGFQEGQVHASIHTTDYNHANGTQKTSTVGVGDVCDAFHLYHLTWTPESIAVGLDSESFFEFANDSAGNSGAWPFNAPQHLLINIAIGGSWGGSAGIDDSVFPVEMVVDYVRIYQPGS